MTELENDFKDTFNAASTEAASAKENVNTAMEAVASLMPAFATASSAGRQRRRSAARGGDYNSVANERESAEVQNAKDVLKSAQKELAVKEKARDQAGK